MKQSCVLVKRVLVSFIVMTSVVRAFTSSVASLWSTGRSRSLSHSSQNDTAQRDNVNSPLSVPPEATSVHVVILVHGYLGNPLELGYLQTAIQKQADRARLEHPETCFVVHSAVANDGKTKDGIAAGGSRLAAEVNEILASLLENNGTDDTTTTPRKVSCSFVGNSLGGLYARYALSEMPLLTSSSTNDNNNKSVTPAVFCTTATPHLGVSRHTYLPLFRAAEFVVAHAMLPTGRDLFGVSSDVLVRLFCEPAFLQPLRLFGLRLAYANAHYTDFQVPTKTAAFLSNEEDANHRRLATTITTDSSSSSSFEVMRVETTKRESSHLTAVSTTTQNGETMTNLSSSQMARILDDMGWIKVFCDVRGNLWSLPIPFTSSKEEKESNYQDQEFFTSAELLQRFGTMPGGRWYAPFGHTLLVANSKNPTYSAWNAPGRPIMDQLAAELVDAILIHSQRSK